MKRVLIMSEQLKNLAKFLPNSKMFDFRQYPFYWSSRLTNKYSHKMEVILKQHGMNITIWRICMLLKQEGRQSITEIAKHAVGRLPTITKTVYKMQSNGLVVIRPRKNDGRVSMVKISKLGLQEVDLVLARMTKLFNSLFEGFTQSELEILNRLMEKLFENLSDN